MSDLNTYKVTDQEVQQHGLQGVVGDRLNLTPNQSKLRFDELPDLIRTKFNSALDRIDSLVAQTNAQTLSTVNTSLNAHDTRITSIEDRITEEGFVASVNANSQFAINTNRAYSDIGTGTVAIGTIIGQLGANTNSIKNTLNSVSDSVSNLASTTQRLSDYDDGARYGNNVNAFTEAGSFYVSRTLTNVPSVFSGRPVWITVKRDAANSSTIYQYVENAERFVDGSVTHQVGSYYRKSANGGSTWNNWTPGNAIEHKLYSGTNLENASFVKIGEVLICMGYTSICPTAKNKQVNKKITFPASFEYEPHIQLSFGWSPETLVVVSANDATSTGFNMALYSDTTSERRVRWMAIGKAVV